MTSVEQTLVGKTNKETNKQNKILKKKLRTEFFPPRFMAQARSARTINRRGKRGSVTYSTDRENEVSKIFIIFLLCV